MTCDEGKYVRVPSMSAGQDVVAFAVEKKCPSNKRSKVESDRIVFSSTTSIIYQDTIRSSLYKRTFFPPTDKLAGVVWSVDVGSVSTS